MDAPLYRYYEEMARIKKPKRSRFWVVLAIVMIAGSLLVAKAYPNELVASWYSVESLKKEGTWKYSEGVMANGKIFDENIYTCAVRGYVLGTILKVTNIQSGAAVIVKVTDRINKRFTGKRLDLSKGAFSRIADCKQGLVPVKVEIVRLAKKR